jgi:calcium-dependent protein kinase
LDKNQDGLLTAAEIKEGLKEVDVPPDLHDILEGIDSDNRGQIDYTEFVAASLQRKYYSQEDVCWAAFNMVDRDGDGKISINELRKVANSGTIAEELGMSTLQNIMAELDLNGDGFIDFKEFKSLVQDSHVRRSSKEIPRQGMRPTQRISKHTQYMELSAGRHARLRSLSL